MELGAARQSVEEKDRDIAALRQRNAEAADEVGRLTLQLESYDKESASLRWELEAICGESISRVQSRDDEVRRLRSEVERLGAARTSLEDERDVTWGAVNRLRARLTEFQAWAQLAQRRIGEVEAESDGLEGKVADLTAAEEAARGDVESARDELERERAEAEKNLEALQREKGDAEELAGGEVEWLRAKAAQLETDTANLAGRNSAMAQDTKVLEGQNAELTSKNAREIRRKDRNEEETWKCEK